jgi:peptide/nickel transport system permease protein
MVTSGRDYMLTGWWTVVVPGIAISLTAMLFNLSGDALRVLNDPT